MHAVVSGWLLGPHSGANNRLLSLLSASGPFFDTEDHVTVLHRPEFSPPDLARIDWMAIDIPTGPAWKRAIREQFRVGKALKELGATVYDHGFLPPPRVPVPTCLTIHDLRAADGHSRWPRWLARSVLRKACRRADAIITPSHWTRRRLHELVPGTLAKTEYLPNGFTCPDEQRPLPRSQPANGYLLHVGHLEARKNLPVALRALAMLSDQEAPELWLAGQDAGAGEALKLLANQLGITARVHHLGPVDDATLSALYRHARAVVMPSIYEGFGMPALEGLAYGLPVLAADATALPEVLGGHGTLLPPNQPEAWASAIRTAVAESQDIDQNPAIAERANYGKHQFDWAVPAERLVMLWRRLSNDGPTASRS